MRQKAKNLARPVIAAVGIGGADRTDAIALIHGPEVSHSAGSSSASDNTTHPSADPAGMLVLPSVLTHQHAETCLHMLRLRINAIAGPKVVADAAALATFDSSALAVLLECRRDALSLGKSFEVAGLTARLAGLAALYGVHALLTPAA